MAENTSAVNYVECAEALSCTIKHFMPGADVTLVSSSVSKSKYVDRVIPLPHGDLAPDSTWKLVNDWQVYEASPYDETIKIEADILIPGKIDYWWDVLKIQDVVVSSAIRDYKGNISPCRAYRKFIDDNKLPDVYNGLTYFKKSTTAETFFKLVKNIFDNWEEYKKLLICSPDEEASTDWVYALACHILGKEKTTLPAFTDMSMVHMKEMIIETASADWTQSLIYELLPHAIRINTHTQTHPFHYHQKSFAKHVLEAYGN